jgi:hypothetical protein
VVRVFISYAQQQCADAKWIAEQIEAAGHRAFLAELDIRAGVDWQDELVVEVRRANALVALVSQAWNDSRWCANEFLALRVASKPIIPVRMEPDVPLPIFGDRLQELDYAKDRDEAAARLTDCLARLESRFNSAARDLLRDKLKGAALEQRERELARLAEFVRGPKQLGWVRGTPYSGKTCVLAWFVCHPEADWRVVSHFIDTQDRAERRTPDAVMRSIEAQLADVLRDIGEEPGEDRRLEQAAAACERLRETLVIVVDGLDASPGANGAAWLPARLPDNVRLLVSSTPAERPYGLPEGLTKERDEIDIVATPRVTYERDAAKAELIAAVNSNVLDHSIAEQVLLFAAAAWAPGLTPADLGGLMTGDRKRTRKIRHVLENEVPRLLFLESGDVPDAEAIRFQHPIFREMAQEVLAEDVPDYRRRLCAWADGHLGEADSASLPDYLLDGYSMMLQETADAIPDHGERLLRLAAHTPRYRRLLKRPEGAAIAETEQRWAIAAARTCPEPPLDLLAAIAVHRRQRGPVHPAIPALWLRMDEPARAVAYLEAVQGRVEPARALVALHAAAVDRELAGDTTRDTAGDTADNNGTLLPQALAERAEAAIMAGPPYKRWTSVRDLVSDVLRRGRRDVAEGILERTTADNETARKLGASLLIADLVEHGRAEEALAAIKQLEADGAGDAQLCRTACRAVRAAVRRGNRSYARTFARKARNYLDKIDRFDAAYRAPAADTICAQAAARLRGDRPIVSGPELRSWLGTAAEISPDLPANVLAALRVVDPRRAVHALRHAVPVLRRRAVEVLCSYKLVKEAIAVTDDTGPWERGRLRAVVATELIGLGEIDRAAEVAAEISPDVARWPVDVALLPTMPAAPRRALAENMLRQRAGRERATQLVALANALLAPEPEGAYDELRALVRGLPTLAPPDTDQDRLTCVRLLVRTGHEAEAARVAQLIDNREVAADALLTVAEHERMSPPAAARLADAAVVRFTGAPIRKGSAGSEAVARAVRVLVDKGRLDDAERLARTPQDSLRCQHDLLLAVVEDLAGTERIDDAVALSAELLPIQRAQALLAAATSRATPPDRRRDLVRAACDLHADRAEAHRPDVRREVVRALAASGLGAAAVDEAMTGALTASLAGPVPRTEQHRLLVVAAYQLPLDGPPAATAQIAARIDDAEGRARFLLVMAERHDVTGGRSWPAVLAACAREAIDAAPADYRAELAKRLELALDRPTTAPTTTSSTHAMSAAPTAALLTDALSTEPLARVRPLMAAAERMDENAAIPVWEAALAAADAIPDTGARWLNQSLIMPRLVAAMAVSGRADAALALAERRVAEVSGQLDAARLARLRADLAHGLAPRRPADARRLLADALASGAWVDCFPALLDVDTDAAIGLVDNLEALAAADESQLPR